MEHHQLRLQGSVSSESELPRDLSAEHRDFVWFIGHVWYIWTGDGWQRAIAGEGPPPADSTPIWDQMVRELGPVAK